jgi:hypothetical protein
MCGCSSKQSVSLCALSSIKWHNCNKQRLFLCNKEGLFLQHQIAVSYCCLHPPPHPPRYSLRRKSPNNKAGSPVILQSYQMALSPVHLSPMTPPRFGNLTSMESFSIHPHSDSVLIRITSRKVVPSFFPTMLGHHSTSPSCWMKC